MALIPAGRHGVTDAETMTVGEVVLLTILIKSE